jgi:small subunit ribosomal protein S4
MARDTSPQCKQCRREGQKLFLKGERCLTDKCGVERRAYPPGDHGRGRQKQSEYRVQLREKQKAKRYYGVLETQFRIYYGKASRQSGVTGENLLRMLECRFDNVLVRLGFAASRRQARQLVLHGHWTINGRRVNIPSYQLRDGDVIAIHAKSRPSSPGRSRRGCRPTTTRSRRRCSAGRSGGRSPRRWRSSSSSSCTPSNELPYVARAALVGRPRRRPDAPPAPPGGPPTQTRRCEDV